MKNDKISKNRPRLRDIFFNPNLAKQIKNGEIETALYSGERIEIINEMAAEPSKTIKLRKKLSFWLLMFSIFLSFSIVGLIKIKKTEFFLYSFFCIIVISFCAVSVFFIFRSQFKSATNDEDVKSLKKEIKFTISYIVSSSAFATMVILTPKNITEIYEGLDIKTGISYYVFVFCHFVFSLFAAIEISRSITKIIARDPYDFQDEFSKEKNNLESKFALNFVKLIVFSNFIIAAIIFIRMSNYDAAKLYYFSSLLSAGVCVLAIICGKFIVWLKYR